MEKASSLRFRRNPFPKIQLQDPSFIYFKDRNCHALAGMNEHMVLLRSPLWKTASIVLCCVLDMV